MPNRRWPAILLVPAAVLAVCGGGSTGSETPPERDEVAGTDLTAHAVPLEDVIFDTFDGGSIPLSAASEEQVLGLRDAIVPIDEPRYVERQPSRRCSNPANR